MPANLIAELRTSMKAAALTRTLTLTLTLTLTPPLSLTPTTTLAPHHYVPEIGT